MHISAQVKQNLLQQLLSLLHQNQKQLHEVLSVSALGLNYIPPLVLTMLSPWK